VAIIRTARAAEGRFTQIANPLLQDGRLSYRARGVACAALSYPPDTVFNSDVLTDGTTEGRDAVRTALRELEALGYLTRSKTLNSKGQWEWEWYITDGPETGSQATVPPAETAKPQVGPWTGSQSMASPAETGKTAGGTVDGFPGDIPKTVVKDVSVKRSVKRTAKPSSAELTDRDFTAFWQVWPKRVGKLQAEKAWKAALKRGASAEQIISRAARQAEIWQQTGKDRQYMPHPSTWLNAGRYDDDQPDTGTVPVAGRQRSFEEREIF